MGLSLDKVFLYLNQVNLKIQDYYNMDFIFVLVSLKLNLLDSTM